MDREQAIQKRLNLKQNKGKTYEEIAVQYDKEQEEESLLMSFTGIAGDKQQKALKLYQQYLAENSFESQAEKSTLINVVYLEMLNDQIKEYIEQEQKEKKGAIPLRMTEQLVINNTQILSLKKVLGMLKDAESDSALDLFNELKEKCLKYYEEHAAEFEFKCPHCLQFSPMILPPDKLESVPSTWFRGTDLYNEEVMNLYHNKIITREQAAKILGTHTSYVEHIYQNIFLRGNDDKKA